MSRYQAQYDGEIDKFYMNITSGRQGSWCLTGESLIYFVRNMTLMGCQNITVGQCESIQKVQPCDTERIKLNIPAILGSELDRINPQWDEQPKTLKMSATKYMPRTCNGVYFTDDRKRNAHELIAGMLKCGEKAGIKDKMFLAFGNVLGYALMDDFLPNDDDIDVNVLADDIPQEQRKAYLVELKNAGLAEKRLKGPRFFEDKYTWFSIADKSREHENGVKACNWFWFKHGGFYWHTKGLGWPDGFAGKGIPLHIFDGKLKEVQFGQNRVNVPVNVGQCLDWWYGQWVEEKGGSSISRTLLDVKNENNRQTWRIVRK